MSTSKTTRTRTPKAVSSKTEVASKANLKVAKKGPPKPRSLPPEMRALREQLSQTLEAWMHGTPRLDTQKKLADASGLGQTTIGRILNCKVSATVDALQQIAAAFGREAGELLLSPELARVHYDVARYNRLPVYERVRVDAFIAEVIKEHTSPNKSGKD